MRSPTQCPRSTPDGRARRSREPQQTGSSPPTLGWLATLVLWSERSRQRRALAELAMRNDDLLADAGLSLDEARREAAKPFWRR
jgi:uncharacterized protein YjiS (DUF1127 family)